MRIYDVAEPLQVSGRSVSAVHLGSSVSMPVSVLPEALDFYTDLYRRHAHLVAIEVLNGTRPLSEYNLDRELWDALLIELMPDRPVWGLAVDDMHSINHLGRDWLTFLSEGLSEQAIRAALDGGTFTYSSTRVRPPGGSGDPPVVEQITHDAHAGRIVLSATSGGAPLPDDAYAWISMGQTIRTGPVFDYRDTAVTGSYVRAEIRGPGGITGINPFGLRQVDRTADSDEDGLPDWWEWTYFGGPTAAEATAITASGMTVADHHIVGSDPHDPKARFVIMAFDITHTGPNRMRLRWPSAPSRVYAIDHAPDLKSGFQPLAGAEAISANPPYNEFDFEMVPPLGTFRVRVRLAD